jgi:hypothetical protein
MMDAQLEARLSSGKQVRAGHTGSGRGRGRGRGRESAGESEIQVVTYLYWWLRPESKTEINEGGRVS